MLAMLAGFPLYAGLKGEDLRGRRQPRPACHRSRRARHPGEHL